MCFMPVRLEVVRTALFVLVVALVSSAPREAAASPAVEIANPEWSILLTDYGYSDILLDLQGVNPDRELLSGEWAAALGYSYEQTVVSPRWLEPEFIFPDWFTNSDFSVITAFHMTGVTNSDGFPVYESVVANEHLRVRMTYQFWDTETGIEQGYEPASSGEGGMSITSSRYILQQTYEITNISSMALFDLKFYQFLHGLNSTEAVYDNRPYGGPFPEYMYDITQRGMSIDLISEHRFDDIVAFHMAASPDAWEVGRYGRLSVDDHVSGKPSEGVHLSVEDDALTGLDYFAPGVPDFLWVSGAQRHPLDALTPGVVGQLAPSEFVTIDALLSIRAVDLPEPPMGLLVAASLAGLAALRSRAKTVRR